MIILPVLPLIFAQTYITRIFLLIFVSLLIYRLIWGSRK